MQGDLSLYLAEVVRRRFAFGDLDCCTLMADWLVRCGWPDPMAERRGAYATRTEYEPLIAGEGGIVKACRRRFASIGLKQTQRPAAGDVCLVLAPTLVGGGVVWAPTGAIAVSDRLRAVVTSDVGLVASELEIVRAWEVSRA